jgi:hypothetical protein
MRFVGQRIEAARKERLDSVPNRLLVHFQHDRYPGTLKPAGERRIISRRSRVRGIGSRRGRKPFQPRALLV